MQISRWLIGGLVLSVVVNLLLVGFVLGRLSGFAPPPTIGPDPTVGFFRMLGFLSDDRRDAIVPDLRKQMGDLMPTLRKVRGDQRAVFDALTTDPFDPAALDAALAGLRANLTAAEVASHHSFVELAKRLTPAERKELARAMHRPRLHGMGGGSEGRDHPPLGVHPGSGRDEPPQEGRQ